MKTILLLILLLLPANGFTEDLPIETIRNCYYQSYQHERQNRYTDAIQDLKPVYQMYKNTYTVNYRLGWLYYLNNNYANALYHLENAQMAIPSSKEVVIIMILVYQAKADWESVERLAVTILKNDFYHMNGNYWYVVSLKMQGKYELAQKVSNKMLTMNPTSIMFLQELGENLYLNQQMEESMTVFNNLLILSQENPTALYYLKKMSPHNLTNVSTNQPQPSTNAK